MSAGAQNVAFPRKLYDLIESEPDELIEWSDAGDCFFIRDQDEFCAQVLAKYFRHTKLTSFQRQLNLYGFRRITKGPDMGAYSHPLFSRDDPSHVDTIKRVVRKGATQGTQWKSNQRRQTGASPNSSHSFPDVIDVPPAFKNVQRQLSSSWPYPSNQEDHDDEDYEDDDEEEDEMAGRRRRQDSSNAYSKPYYTTQSRSRRAGSEGALDHHDSSGGGGMDMPRRSHKYGTRGVSASFDTDSEEWDGYPHSAPSHSGFGDMEVESKGASMMQPPPQRNFNYSDKSVARNQLSPRSPSYSHPSSSGAFILSRATNTSSSDLMEQGGGPLDLNNIPKMARSTSAMSAEMNVSLAGSDTWNFDNGMTSNGSNLDLKDLDGLDNFDFDAFGEAGTSAFPMDDL